MICKEVPFKKMTKKAGFQPVILEEMRRRGIQLSEEEKKNYTVTIWRFKEHIGNKGHFSPLLPFERFKWY